MDSETGSVDILSEKPRNGVRRGHGRTVRNGPSRDNNSTSGLNALIGKTVRGTGISEKKSKAMSNSVLNGLSPGVLYSLKKKNRWQGFSDVDSVLDTVKQNPPSFAVSAVERNPTGHLSNISDNKEVLAYGRLKANSKRVETVSARGRSGAPLVSLEDSLAYKDKKKNKSQKKEAEPQKPEVVIVIDRPGYVQKPIQLNDDDSAVVATGKKQTQRSKNICNQLHDEDFDDFYDDEGFEFEDEEFVDEFDIEVYDGETVEDSGNFQLSDFIKFPSEKKEKIHQKKIKEPRFIDEILPGPSDSKTQEKPLKENDILKDSSFFAKAIDLSSYFWNPASFISKLEVWAKMNEKTINIIWMDEKKTRCFINFSKILDSKNLIAVIGFTLLGEDKKFLRITFNTDFPFEDPEKKMQEFSEEEFGFGCFFDLILECLKESANLVNLRKDFKYFKEAFRCNPGVTVESFTDYDFMEMFLESPKAPSPSTSSYSCEFCDHKNPENLIQLSCSHCLCLSCAKSTFRGQILNHSKDLVCPICGDVQNVMNLTVAVPVSLIRAFLKEKFTKSSNNKIQECPRCLRHFEKNSENSSVSCEHCSISFCQDCLQPPHFPISCDQMKTWSPKFKRQYDIYCLRKLPRYGHCSCGNCFPLPTYTKYDYYYSRCRECNACYRTNKEGTWVYWDNEQVIYLKVLKPSELPTYINKSVFDSYMEVKNDIQNEKKVDKIKQLGREFLLKYQLIDFIELRFKALKLIEYGIVWLYLERKNEGSEKNKQISRVLKKMKSLLDSIISQMMNCDNVKIKEDFESLKNAYSKALTLF